MRTSRPALMLALVLPLAGCKSFGDLLAAGVKKPTAEFVQLHLRDLSLESITLDFELKVNNPNSLGATLEKLDYRLQVDGQRLMSGTSADKLSVPAKGSAPVRLPLTLTYAELADAVKLLLSDAETVPYQLGLGLTVRTPVGPVELPLDHEGTVPLPKLPEVSVADVRLAKLGFSGARVEVAVNVKNRGKFPIRPKGFRYALALAGVDVSAGQQVLPTIGEHGQKQVVLPIDLEFLRLGAAVVEAVRTKRLPYRLEGELDLGLLAQPFELSGEADL